jgi:hypothetical protein
MARHRLVGLLCRHLDGGTALILKQRLYKKKSPQALLAGLLRHSPRERHRGAVRFLARANEGPTMPRKLWLALLFTGALGATSLHAQTTMPDGRPRPDCPPGVGANAPSVGQDSKRTLSDQLAASKGIICPPAGVDPEMQQRPPEGGALKVIPPPGAPGGNPNIQPK